MLSLWISKYNTYHRDKYVRCSVDRLGWCCSHTEGKKLSQHFDDCLHHAKVIHDVDKRKEEHDDR